VKREFCLENVFEGETVIEEDNRKIFIRIDEPLEVMDEFEIENSRQPKSFHINTSTAGESTIDPCIVHSH
jgi:hypothetical protein